MMSPSHSEVVYVGLPALHSSVPNGAPSLRGLRVSAYLPAAAGEVELEAPRAVLHETANGLCRNDSSALPVPVDVPVLRLSPSSESAVVAASAQQSCAAASELSAGSMPLLLSAAIWGPGTAGASASGSGSDSPRAGPRSMAATCQQNVCQPAEGSLRLSPWHAAQPEAACLLADQARPIALSNTRPESWKPLESTLSLRVPASVREPELPIAQHDNAVNMTGNRIGGPELGSGWYGHCPSGSEPPVLVPVPVLMAAGTTADSGSTSSAKERCHKEELLHRLGQGGFDLPGLTASTVAAALVGFGAGPSRTAELLNLNCMPKEGSWLMMDAGEMHCGKEAGKDQMLLAEQQAGHQATENQCVAVTSVSAPGIGAFTSLPSDDFKESVTAAAGGWEDGAIRSGGGRAGEDILKQTAGEGDSCGNKMQTAAAVHQNTSDSGGGSSRQAPRKRKRQRGKAENEGPESGGRAEGGENKGAKKGTERVLSKSRFAAGSASGSFRASPSANEKTVTAGRQAVSSDSRMNDEGGVREKGERSAGLGDGSSGEEGGSCIYKQEWGESEKDGRVTEKIGRECGSGASVESDSCDLFRQRKKPGPSRKGGPVSKGCRDSRVSKHGIRVKCIVFALLCASCLVGVYLSEHTMPRERAYALLKKL